MQTDEEQLWLDYRQKVNKSMTRKRHFYPGGVYYEYFLKGGNNHGCSEYLREFGSRSHLDHDQGTGSYRLTIVHNNSFQKIQTIMMVILWIIYLHAC